MSIVNKVKRLMYPRSWPTALLSRLMISLKKKVKILRAVRLTYSCIQNRFQVTADFMLGKDKVCILLRDGSRFLISKDLFFQLVFVAYMRGFYPVRSEEGEIVLSNGLKINPNSSDIFLDMLISKGWELEGDILKKGNVAFLKYAGTNSIFEIFEEHLYEAEVYEKIVVDIGAGVGDSVIWFANKGARVIAFEPSPEAYQYALRNLELNSHLKDRVALHNAAVGLKDSYIIFKDQRGKMHRVPQVTLSKVLKAIDDPFLLKIDCEGCEYPLVMNDWEHIRLFKQIIIEYHPNMTGIPLKRLLAYLEREYTCEKIIGDELLGVMKCIKKKRTKDQERIL